MLLFSCLMIIIPYVIVTIFIKDEEITFNFSSNTIVRVYREESKIIEKVPIEQYVVGVVSGEMPASFNYEALKAQAVASRTYVMYQMQVHKNDEYDVYDSVNSQVYLSEEQLKEKWKDKYIENINKIKQAILDTSGQFLTYNGEVIESFFFSTSVGYTENSEDVFSLELPYLRSVESKWDSISPAYIDQKTLKKEEFFNLLSLDNSNTLDIEIIEKTSTGRIKKIKINGKILTGKQVCSKLQLRSTFFEIKEEGGNVVINTKGYGHGVGMSQYGANGMASSGFTYDEILKYYYTDVEIEKF